MSESNAVISLAGALRSIYAAPDTGDIHCWDLEEGIKFKRVPEFKVHSPRFIFCTRNQIIIMRGTLQSKRCFIKEDKQNDELHSCKLCSFLPFQLLLF